MAIPSSAADSVSSEAQALGDLPIGIDPDGVIRVGRTRVRLETVLQAFDLGCAAEEILLKYPSLDLGDIYAILAAYIRRPDDFLPYLRRRREQIERSDREVESRHPSAEARARLLSRRKATA